MTSGRRVAPASLSCLGSGLLPESMPVHHPWWEVLRAQDGTTVSPVPSYSFLPAISVFSPSSPHLGRQETHLVVLVSRSRVKGAGLGRAALLS